MVRRRQFLSTMPVAESIRLPPTDQNLLLHNRRAHLQIRLCRVAGLSCTDYCTCVGGDHCCNPMTIRHDNDHEDDDDNEDCEDEKDH